MKMANTTYRSSKDMIIKLQQLKGRTKLKFYKDIFNYYDIMTIRINEDLFARNGQSISKNYHEVLLLKKLLQTKPQVKKIDIKHYDLYYTVIKNRDEKEIVNDQYENIEKMIILILMFS